MGHRRKRDPGPHQHAEGVHGDKTHRRFIEQLHESPPDRERGPDAGASMERHMALREDRQQHDEAEKSSELSKEHGDTH